MSEETKKKTIVPPTNEQQGNALRFLIGAIKANLLGMFYDYDHHSFLTAADLSTIEKGDLRVTGPRRSLDPLVAFGWDKTNTFKMWCPCVFSKGNIGVIRILQVLLGDGNPKYTEGQREEAMKYVNPAFYLAAILVVVRHLNTIDDRNVFRAAYVALRGVPADTHFVYRFMDEFTVPKTTAALSPFDIITEAEARQLSDVEGYKRISRTTTGTKDPAARLMEIRRLMEEAKCVIYTELSKPADRDSPLVGLHNQQFILTNVWLHAYELKRTSLATVNHHLKEHVITANIVLPLHGDNREDIPRIQPFEAGPPSSSKPPMSDKKPEPEKEEKPAKGKRKADIKMPGRNPETVVDPVKVAEEKQKKLWSDEISGKMVEELLEYCSTPQGKAKVLQALNVAAGLPGKTTKVGGNTFNLNSTRLLKENNNNTGIVMDKFDGAPLFPGRMIRLAVNVKDKKVPIIWFKESKIGTNVNLTSNNLELAAWVKEQLIPKVWRTFAASFAEDASAIGGKEGDDEEENEDERVDGVKATDNDENEEPETLFGKKRDFATEMDFISAHAAMLPVINFEGDLSKLGGSLDAQRAQRFNINKAAMGLDREELKRLEVVRNNMAAMFKPDTQSVINTIRKNIRVELGEPVGFNGAPFDLEEPEKVEEAQFTADYRSGVAGQFASADFDAEYEEDEDQ
jgi:hypothetical protein